MNGANTLHREREHARVAARRADRRAVTRDDFELLGVLIAMFAVILVLTLTIGVSLPA